MQRSTLSRLRYLLAPLLLVGGLSLALWAGLGVTAAQAGGETYANPLLPAIPSGGVVESCADPTVIRAAGEGVQPWYMYCTTDPLNDEDQVAGEYNFHLIPMFSSLDLVNWTYLGDAAEAPPEWLPENAGLWAPDIYYEDGTYFLYYTAPETDVGGSAIGVMTSTNPAGPWTDSGGPVVEPHEADCCAGSRRWVFDPDVIEVDGQKYIFYGSYFGGLSARTLSEDGLTSDPASQTPIAIANRYEGTHIVEHDGYFYLFASASNCCNGPLTGYSVFAGRSENILGPYVDREGAALLAGRVGGTPTISLNGNRWVGPGHNVVFSDFDGQDWTIYHAIDQGDPYFADAVGFTKRPALLDPLDWVDGWPTVRGGYWASDEPMPAPAAQPGETTDYVPTIRPQDEPGTPIDALSDEFDDTLGAQWSWVREPDPLSDTYGVEDGYFRFNTQPGDLFVDSNNASVLVEATPAEDFVVETRISLTVPAEGCCFNYAQAGLVIYGDDDNFIKLTHASIFETRQTEFAKEEAPVAEGYPRYGNTLVTAPGEWTWLRIAKRTLATTSGDGDTESYTAYVSRDGVTWNQGGTWTHTLGPSAQIGLVSMGAEGFTARFDYVRVSSLDVPTAVTLAALDAQPAPPAAWPLLAGVATAAVGALVALRRRRL